MTNKIPANQWKPGQSGNPAGRPPGQSAITRLRAQLEPDAPQILETMVAAAKGGDVQAARLILERILPPFKPTEQAMELALEGKTLTDKGRAVLGAVSAGELAPGQGSQLIVAIGTLARVAEIDDLERRIAELERSNAEH
jgi:hypothetical protein